jgi:PAP2 superfamily
MTTRQLERGNHLNLAGSPTTTRPVRTQRWWVQVLVIAGFYGAYERTRAAAPTHPARALRHAKAVVSLEQTLHLNIEAPINRVLAHHDLLGAVSAYYYATFHFVVTGGVLLWLYIRRPELYSRARNGIVAASFSALFVYWLFPVAPPRLAVRGMTDIVVDHNVFNAAHAATSGGFVDIYAALPSLHVGWAVWAALWLYRANPNRRPRLMFWLYPLTTTFVVLGTANHYTLDAIAGAGMIVAADTAIRLVRTSIPRAPTVALCKPRAGARPEGHQVVVDLHSLGDNAKSNYLPACPTDAFTSSRQSR